MGRALLPVLISTAFIFSGCARSDNRSDIEMQQAKDYEEQLTKLEKVNRKLKKKLEGLETHYANETYILAQQAKDHEERLAELEIKQAEMKYQMVTSPESEAGSSKKEGKQIDEQRMRQIFSDLMAEKKARQKKEQRARTVENRLKHLTRMLKLNDVQKEQVKDLVAQPQQAMRDAFERIIGSSDWKEIMRGRKKRQEFNEEVALQINDAMYNILSSAQFEKYEKSRMGQWIASWLWGDLVAGKRKVK